MLLDQTDCLHSLVSWAMLHLSRACTGSRPGRCPLWGHVKKLNTLSVTRNRHHYSTSQETCWFSGKLPMFQTFSLLVNQNIAIKTIRSGRSAAGFVGLLARKLATLIVDRIKLLLQRMKPWSFQAGHSAFHMYLCRMPFYREIKGVESKAAKMHLGKQFCFAEKWGNRRTPLEGLCSF